MVPVYQTTRHHIHYDYNLKTYQLVDLFPATRSMVPTIETGNKYSETCLQQKRKGPKFIPFQTVSLSHRYWKSEVSGLHILRTVKVFC